MKSFWGILAALTGLGCSTALSSPCPPAGPDPRDPAQRAEPAAPRKAAPASPEGEKPAVKAPSQADKKN